MRPPLLLVASILATACDRPTAPQVVQALERHDAEALAGATGWYYTARFGFNTMRIAAAIEPVELVVTLNGRTELWEAIAIERRYVRDSVAGRPCPDVWHTLVAIRDEERAVIEMGGADFSKPLGPWDWCANEGSEGFASPFLWLIRFSNEIATASEGQAQLEMRRSLGGACTFRDDRSDEIRVDCERIEMLVSASATLVSTVDPSRAQTIRIEPKIVPGVLLTTHCNYAATVVVGFGGCQLPNR